LYICKVLTFIGLYTHNQGGHALLIERKTRR